MFKKIDDYKNKQQRISRKSMKKLRLTEHRILKKKDDKHKMEH